MRDSDDYQPADDAHLAYVRAEAIAHCGLCDDEGMRGLHRCDHRTDFAAAAKRGMALIRPMLAKKDRR